MAQQHTGVEAGAPDEEVVHRPLAALVLPPGLAQPFAVRLKAASGQHAGAGGDALALHIGRFELPAVQLDAVHRRVIAHLHPQAFGAAEVGVDQGLAAAHKKGVGAGGVQGARQGRLKAHPVAHHPRPACARGADHQPRQRLVGLATSDLEQVLPKLLFGVGAHQHVLGFVVHAAQVAGVGRVAAAPGLGRGLQQQHAGAGFAGHEGGAQGGVAATNHQHIHIGCHVAHSQSGLMRARLTMSLQMRCSSLMKAANSAAGPPPPTALSVAKRSVTALERRAL